MWHFEVVSVLGDLKIVAVPFCASVLFCFLLAGLSEGQDTGYLIPVRWTSCQG